MAVAGDRERARRHHRLGEKSRIPGRLEPTQAPRRALIHGQYPAFLGAILARRGEEAQLLLKALIEVSKAEVPNLTLHSARQWALLAQG